MNTTYLTVNLVVLAVLLVGGYFVIRELQKRGIIKDTGKREKKGPANPVTGDKTSVIAVVAGISNNLRNPGEPETYYVICSYKDPDSKLSTTFTSRELRQYPGKEIIGRPVRVLVDPKDPEHYTVEIDSILKKR